MKPFLQENIPVNQNIHHKAFLCKREMQKKVPGTFSKMINLPQFAGICPPLRG
jgi:hypothetical protein